MFLGPYHMPSSRKGCFFPQWVTILVVCSVFTVSSPEAETIPSSFLEDSETSGRSSLSSHASISLCDPFFVSLLRKVPSWETCCLTSEEG